MTKRFDYSLYTVYKSKMKYNYKKFLFKLAGLIYNLLN